MEPEVVQARLSAHEQAGYFCFHAILFARNPEVRPLFPPGMDARRGRLLRALAHFPAVGECLLASLARYEQDEAVRSPRADGTLTFHVRVVAGGSVSGAPAHRAAVGDVIQLGPPLGDMVLDAATCSEVDRRGEPRQVDLFPGARTPVEPYGVDDMLRIAQRYHWLTSRRPPQAARSPWSPAQMTCSRRAAPRPTASTTTRSRRPSLPFP
ncbi:hypothetical protein [Streptomyces sp. HUAS ZL42]|uniref:hypothetical protein n=1 Tax=Streptomyces sp. HUAS ZL42 TaxID=3231715 RepID=UPI00345ED6BF